MLRNKRFKYLIFFPGVITERPGVTTGLFPAIKTHKRRFSYWVFLSLFILVLGAAAYLRFWAAPLSTGVDVPQFWAFAKVFQIYGLDFYRYADASLDIFPVNGWGFVYPPVWLLILRLALVFTPEVTATETFIDPAWRLAEKTPIILADLAIGCLLYFAITGPKWKKLLFSGLWLLHPTAWYNSAVFGQFDAIAAALLLASVIMLERGNDKAAFLIAGLAILTKQHVFIPVILMLAVSVRRLGWRRTLTDGAILAGTVAAFSIPFLITGNFFEYGRSLILPGQMPDYQTPLMYAFSGSGALLTYLHQIYGWDTAGYLVYNIPVMIAMVLAALYLSWRTGITYTQAALAGFLIFIALNYRVNYQYLVIFIPLALWAAAQSKRWNERIFAAVMAMVPAVWLWIFDVFFWFHYARPANLQVMPVLERLGLARLGTPDYAFVVFAVVLMCLFLAYIILTFTLWRKPPKDKLLGYLRDNDYNRKYLPEVRG